MQGSLANFVSDTPSDDDGNSERDAGAIRLIMLSALSMFFLIYSKVPFFKSLIFAFLVLI